MSGRVLVVGSVNVDTTHYVPRLPRPGETVAAARSLVALGGKGANQAVAAHRFGVATELVGAVGEDAAGDFALAALRRLGLDVGAVVRLAGVPTGAAAITVDAGGENTVVVAGGANRMLGAADAAAAVARFAARGGVVLAQGELESEVVDAVAAAAAGERIRFVLNLAPVIPVAAATLAAADPLLVNAIEARALGLAPDGESPAAWVAAARDAVGRGLARSLVVTLGADGAVAARGPEAVHRPAPAVRAIDTTGAGDCFAGTVAAVLAEDGGLEDALGVAVVAAAASVEAAGTVGSYLGRAEVLARVAARPWPRTGAAGPA